MDSVSYYDTHRDRFIASTVSVDMQSLYRLFLERLKPGAKILDAGCGSGRDSLAFKQMGYQVEAFDLSEAMVEATKKLAEIPVSKMGFLDLDSQDAYDGIWASASLLHVPREQMHEAFRRLSDALKAKGILYCSYKNRPADFSQDGRTFTCYTPDSFRAFVRSQGDFELLQLQETSDKRPGREGEGWINAVLGKKG